MVLCTEMNIGRCDALNDLRIDCHTHSDFSRDGADPITYMCEAAVGKELDILTITDHCEINAYYENLYDLSILQSYVKTREAAQIFENQLCVLTGIEIGQPMEDVKTADEVLRKNAFDFVLASVHNLPGQEDFYFLEYDAAKVPNLLNSYFHELLRMIEWGNFDSLAHIDYPLRYISGVHGIPVDLNDYPLLDEVVGLLAKKDKALEINGSGVRQPIGRTLPGVEAVRRFRELGGKYITVGSDSHDIKNIFGGVSEAVKTASDAGFKHIAVYRGRIPELLEI